MGRVISPFHRTINHSPSPRHPPPPSFPPTPGPEVPAKSQPPPTGPSLLKAASSHTLLCSLFDRFLFLQRSPNNPIYLPFIPPSNHRPSSRINSARARLDENLDRTKNRSYISADQPTIYSAHPLSLQLRLLQSANYPQTIQEIIRGPKYNKIPLRSPNVATTYAKHLGRRSQTNPTWLTKQPRRSLPPPSMNHLHRNPIPSPA